MAFKARFSRREPEGYTATFGKGSKQLTAVLTLAAGKWGVESGLGFGEITPAKKIAEVKAAWEAMALANYGEAVPPNPHVPPPPPKLAPPSLRRKAEPQTAVSMLDDTHGEGWTEPFTAPDLAPEGTPVCPHCARPFNGWTFEKLTPTEHARYLPPCRCNMPNTEEYIPDPLDFRMYKRGESGKMDVLTPLGALDRVYRWMQRNQDYVKTNGVLDPVWRGVQASLFHTTGYAEYRPALWAEETR